MFGKRRLIVREGSGSGIINSLIIADLTILDGTFQGSAPESRFILGIIDYGITYYILIVAFADRSVKYNMFI